MTNGEKKSSTELKAATAKQKGISIYNKVEKIEKESK
jgi:hypothetical protein